MTVALLPPVTSAPTNYLLGAEPLTEGPLFVRTKGMSRWHRPRSGVLYPEDRTVFDLWCGYTVGGSERAGSYLAADELGTGEPVCATCEGRAAGAGREVSPTGRQLVFNPRHITPPKHCPGSRSSLLFTELSGGRAGLCLACKDVHPLRAMGGAFNPRWAIVQHPPGGGLVAPCPFHRWKSLTARDGRAACACGRTTSP